MKKIILSLMISLVALTSHAQTLLLGDVNQDGKVTVADVMMVVNIIMKGYTPFTVAPTSVTMPVGGTATLVISGGYNQYEVTSANTAIVEASLSGTSITLSAIASGETKVIVCDVLTRRYVEVPVTVEYGALQLSSSELSIFAGNQGTVNITSGSGSYSAASSDTGVATATVQSGKVSVTAVAAGTATITVTDRRSGETATIAVTVSAGQTSYLACPDDHHPHLIDLGLPSHTKWACCNVDTDHPEKQSPTNYGGYYAWGETETKTTYNESTYKYYQNGSYVSLGSDIAGTLYDVAHVKWGGRWVMPSHDQQVELLENCTSEWTTVNGVNGRVFTSKTNGGSIFLPAAGYHSSGSLYNAGSYGRFWSSTQSPSYSDDAYCLLFGSGSVDWYDAGRCYGPSVRPVASN